MLDVELLQRLPYSDQVLDLVKRCEGWLPRSLTGRAIVFGTVVGVTFYLVTKKRYKLPPGPRGWPLLGNLLEFRNVTIYEKLMEWQTKHGPIITVNMGPVSAVTLNRIDVVLEALVKRQADLAGRPQSYSTDLFSDGGRSIALGDYSPTWKLHRKLATKALKHYMTGNQLEGAIERSLTKGIQLMKEKKGPFNPHDIITLIVFNIINNICYNETCDVNDKYFQNMMGMFDTAANEIGNGLLEDVIPPLRLCPTAKTRRILKLVDTYNECLREKFMKHKQTRSQGTTRDFCDAMLLAQDEASDEEDPGLMSQLSDRHIQQTLSDIFGAGLDTSRFTLLWTVLYLAMHPDIQDKVHAEVDKALGSRQFPKVSDRSNLPFIEAVLYESMRISSVAPLGVPHKSLCDTTVGGFEIQKGTLIMINHHALHHDPRQWRDPEVFRPERFLDQTGKMAPKPESWLPFSAGRRVCLGESVAKPELHLLLAGIMRHFKVSLPPGTKLNFEQRGGSFLSIPNEYEITVEARI